MATNPMFYMYIYVVFMLWTGFFYTPIYSISFNITVAVDGTGDVRTIGAAISAAPDNSMSRFYVHIKPGTYYERVVIPSTKSFITLIGDDAMKTIIVYNRSYQGGYSTGDTTTLNVLGNNFMAQFLTFENSAGPQGGQAVAVLDYGHYTSYYKCRFLGFQDTLYAGGSNQFFKDCDIYGTIDFIFGNGRSMFQDSNIYGRLPSIITVTAQSKDDPSDLSGYCFQNCTITSSPEITSERKKDVKIYLGRPWRQYATVVVMESFLDSVVVPEGWSDWQGGVSHDNVFYAEYNNDGPGADVRGRVKWTTFHVLNRNLALEFTANNFINASNWLPETGIPFRQGLIS